MACGAAARSENRGSPRGQKPTSRSPPACHACTRLPKRVNLPSNDSSTWPIGPWRCLPTVSYTHLDVYKRQDHYIRKARCLRPLKVRNSATKYRTFRFLINHPINQPMASMTTFTIFRSVSYTHLDVYKRQGYPCARGWWEISLK